MNLINKVIKLKNGVNTPEEKQSELTQVIAKENSVSKEEKEESMDIVHEFENPSNEEKTESKVFDFLEKYSEGNNIIQILRKDLMAVASDINWIIESNNLDEQFALDFADALNELSVSIQ